MIDYSIGESPLAYKKQFKQILKHIGVRSGIGYTIPSYFHCFVNGPRKSQFRVIAMEIKINDPRLEDEYVVNAALKFASEYLKKGRYFILGGNFDGWAEITKAEFKALGLLDSFKKCEHIISVEYDKERGEVVAIGKNSKTTCFNVYDYDEFWQIVDAMGEIRNGDFYTRIKEAKTV